MEYSVGGVGRVVAARLFEGEDLHACVEGISREQEIRSAAVLVTGGLRTADIVVGPKQEQPRIEPRLHPFAGPGEALGVGTLYWDDGGPRLHVHAAIGKDGQSLIGCARHETRTFLVLEVTIIELVGIEGTRQLDPASGMNLLHLQQHRRDE